MCTDMYMHRYIHADLHTRTSLFIFGYILTFISFRAPKTGQICDISEATCIYRLLYSDLHTSTWLLFVLKLRLCIDMYMHVHGYNTCGTC